PIFGLSSRRAAPFLALPLGADELAVLGVVDVVFLDPVALVELELADHLPRAVAGREDLEDHLGSDAALPPLLVGAAVPSRPAEGHHHVGGLADDVVALHRIPEEVPGHEDVL